MGNVIWSTAALLKYVIYVCSTVIDNIYSNNVFEFQRDFFAKEDLKSTMNVCTTVPGRDYIHMVLFWYLQVVIPSVLFHKKPNQILRNLEKKVEEIGFFFENFNELL